MNGGFQLSWRRGPRPQVPAGLPHIQLDQWPPAVLVGQLLAQARALPQVVVRQSRMASPETSALCLDAACAGGPHEAFIDASEFCHLHPLPEGTIHLTLPAPERGKAIAFGWAEEHPVARTGPLFRCLLTVYAPRDDEELAMALRLIERSRQFAAGTQHREVEHG